MTRCAHCLAGRLGRLDSCKARVVVPCGLVARFWERADIGVVLLSLFRWREGVIVSFIVQDREKAELIAERLQAVQLFGSSFQLTVEQYVEGVNAEQIGGGILPDLPELIDAAYRDVKFNARTGKFEFVPEGVILAEEAERGVKSLIEELNVRADIIMLQGMVRVAESEGRIERDSLLAINDALELVDIYQEDGSDQISLGEKVVRGGRRLSKSQSSKGRPVAEAALVELSSAPDLFGDGTITLRAGDLMDYDTSFVELVREALSE